jgi:hypothetical protein
LSIWLSLVGEVVEQEFSVQILAVAEGPGDLELARGYLLLLVLITQLLLVAAVAPIQMVIILFYLPLLLLLVEKVLEMVVQITVEMEVLVVAVGVVDQERELLEEAETHHL